MKKKLKMVKVLNLPPTWILIDSKRNAEEAKFKWIDNCWNLNKPRNKESIMERRRTKFNF